MGRPSVCPVDEKTAKNRIVTRCPLNVGARLPSSKAAPSGHCTVGFCDIDPVERKTSFLYILVLHHWTKFHAYCQPHSFCFNWLAGANQGLNVDVRTIHCRERSVYWSNSMLQFSPKPATMSCKTGCGLHITNTCRYYLLQSNHLYGSAERGCLMTVCSLFHLLKMRWTEVLSTTLCC